MATPPEPLNACDSVSKPSAVLVRGGCEAAVPHWYLHGDPDNVIALAMAYCYDRG